MSGILVLVKEDDLPRRLDDMSTTLNRLSRNQLTSSDVESLLTSKNLVLSIFQFNKHEILFFLIELLPGQISTYLSDSVKLRALLEEHKQQLTELRTQTLREVVDKEEFHKMYEGVREQGIRRTDKLIEEKSKQFDDFLAEHGKVLLDMRNEINSLKQRQDSADRWNFWLTVGQIFTLSVGAVWVSKSWSKQ